MTDWIADGRIPRGDGVVFVNTGGAPAIYQYAAGIADSLENIE
jgi:hypothetical protein